MASSNEGKSLSEYMLILALVILVALPTIGFLGNAISDGFSSSSTKTAAGSSQLTTLLDPDYWAEGVNTGTSHPYGSTQPVGSVAFNYNAATGLVGIVDTATGTATTSGEGTTLLVQGLQELLASYPGVMSVEQETLLNQLISQGLDIAAEEKRLLSTYPNMATANPENIQFFDAGGVDSTLYHDFLNFSKIYIQLSTSLEGSDALVLQMKDTIDINASLISQLAKENFIQAQLDHDGYPSEVVATNNAMIAKSDIDITQITISETPGATEDAAKGIK